MDDIKAWIKSYERFSSHPHLDPYQKVTIGWGRRIDERGISAYEANILFENDFAKCERDLLMYPWFFNSPDNIQDALINMCFSLGIEGLLSFKKMIAALNDNDFTKASIEVLESSWAISCFERAKDVSLMIRQG